MTASVVDGTAAAVMTVAVTATMSSLGYGAAPVAVTNAELAFGIFCQVLGACLAAAIFSNIAKLIEKLDANGDGVLDADELAALVAASVPISQRAMPGGMPA